MQTKRHSIIESCTNVASGMMIAFVISQLAHTFEPQIQKYIWKGFIWKVSIGSNIIMTTILTIISVVRGYAWRRYFNKKTTKEIKTSKGLLDQLDTRTKFRGSLFKPEGRNK